MTNKQINYALCVLIYWAALLRSKRINNGVPEALDAVIDGLENSRWIPSDEKCPGPEDKDYEVTIEAGNGPYTTHAGWTGKRWRAPRGCTVEAWRELSEPYKHDTAHEVPAQAGQGEGEL